MFATRRIEAVMFLIAASWVAPTVAQESLSMQNGNKSTEQQRSLSPVEAHLRTGVVMLAKLYKCLEGVKDSNTAQSAVPGVVQITRDLQTWVQTLYGMKEESDEQEILERTYVPIIEKLNSYIEVQGERLSAANYFGSQDLATALTALYITAQQ